MKKLIIIPAYNESECIENTVKDIITNAGDFDYVVINDCSTDNTGEICEEKGFNHINLPVNLGVAVQVDGYGQHDVAFLYKMYEKMEETGYDMVIGSRFIEKEGFQSSIMRRAGISYFSGLIKMLTGVRITDPTSGLRMIDRKIIGLFAEDYPKDYPEPESVVAVLRSGCRVCEVPVVMRERQGGVSSIRPLKSVYYMIKVSLAILVECIRKRRL